MRSHEIIRTLIQTHTSIRACLDCFQSHKAVKQTYEIRCHTHTHAYDHIHMRTICVFIHIHIYIHMHMHTPSYTYTYTCIPSAHPYTYTCMHTIRVFIHIHIHIHELENHASHMQNVHNHTHTHNQYEKEIVMYAHFKKLDYFSTECIYSPHAYRVRIAPQVTCVATHVTRILNLNRKILCACMLSMQWWRYDSWLCGTFCGDVVHELSAFIHAYM
jgi:hypothetical protein